MNLFLVVHPACAASPRIRAVESLIAWAAPCALGNFDDYLILGHSESIGVKL